MKRWIVLGFLAILLLLPFSSQSIEPGLIGVAEEDGNPSAWFYKLKFTNGSLTDNGDGTASISLTPLGFDVDAPGDSGALLQSDGTKWGRITSLSGLSFGGFTNNTVITANGSGNLESSSITEDGTDINAQALNFVTTGKIAGKVGVIRKATNSGYTLGTDAAREAYGYMVFLDTTGTTITLPTAVQGMSACFYATTGTPVMRINPANADTITLNGTGGSAGVDIYSSGTKGDFICIIADTAGSWTTLGRSGTWTSGS